MDIYDFLAVFVVFSIVLIVFFVNLKMYYYYKVEEMRHDNKVSSFVKFLFIPSKLGLESTIKYLFTFPEKNDNDDSNTILFIKRHNWTVLILAFLILVDVILLLSDI
jgi:hypothetical protein